MTGLVPLGTVLLLAVVFSWWYRRRGGRLVHRGATPDGRGAASGSAAGAAEGSTGRRLVLYTLPDCGLCPQARRVAEAAAAPRGIPVETVDLATSPERVGADAVRRVPTLVVTAGGTEVTRVGGVPDPHRLATALDDLLPGG